MSSDDDGTYFCLEHGKHAPLYPDPERGTYRPFCWECDEFLEVEGEDT